MARSWGRPGSTGMPAGAGGATPAARVPRTGWRDWRLWVGVLLVVASVVLGARVLDDADETVPVWAVATDLGAGDQVTSSDLVARRVRFADEADLDLYLPAEDPLPADLSLLRGVGAGELLPRAALGSAADAGTLQVPIDVEPDRVPPSVGAGSVVDVYVADGAGRGGGSGPALEAVTVVDAPPAEESLALTGRRQLVLAVPEDDVADFEALLGRLDEPVVRVLKRS